jgi:hypothetical protein
MDRAISEEEKKLLLKNAKIKETLPLEQLMPEILLRNRSHGFAREAMNDRKSENYKWAHTTSRGIIWLWLQQKDEAIRAQWLREPKGQWRNFEPSPSPPPDSPIRFSSESASASRASAAYAKAGPLSFEPVSVPSSPRSSPRSSPHSSPRKHKGAGYPKRRTNKMRKTRRKSSRSRSRSHHIRRKKTHHRRHHR